MIHRVKQLFAVSRNGKNLIIEVLRGLDLWPITVMNCRQDRRGWTTEHGYISCRDTR